MKVHQLLLMLFFTAFSINSFCQQQVLQPGKTYSKKLQKDENHVYTLSLDKGGYAELTVMQKGVDVAIDLIDPAGKNIKTFDSPNGTDGPEPVSFVASIKGKYRL